MILEMQIQLMLKPREVAQPTMPAVSSAWSECDAKQREQALGFCFILTVAVIWVAASFLVQNLEQQGINPFLLTYIANSLFIVLIPVSIAFSRGGSVVQPRAVTHLSGSEDKHLLTHAGVGEVSNSPSTTCNQSSAWKHTFGDRQLRHAAFTVAPLWFGAQLAFNFSLSMTNVTSNTILSSTSGLFTYVLSCLLLAEAFNLVKLLSILICITGVAMVTLADSTNSKGGQSLLGDMLCLLSSLLYAMYTIAIRKMLPDDSQANVTGLFGLVGLLNLVCMAPILVLLWSVSLVQLQGLTAWLVFLVVCKGLFDNVLSDYLWARAVLLTGPTIATVGLSIQVPFAVLAEASFTQPAWLSHHGSTALMVVGAVAVILGFLGVTLRPAVVPHAHIPSEDAEMLSPSSAAAL